MELLPLGPVLFVDTAGIDDAGTLGELRVQKTRQVLERADLGVVVAEAGRVGRVRRAALWPNSRRRKIPAIVVFNKTDAAEPDPVLWERLGQRQLRRVRVSALKHTGIAEFRQALLEAAPADFIDHPAILGDLVGPGELAVLVVPIDKEAPRGRLILPQVQAIRDLLDNDALCLVVKERELRSALERLKSPPRLVVTDSQAFLKVAADTPREVPLTSFSILMARFKGDLTAQVQGALAIETSARRRPRPDRRGLLAPSDRRGHRQGEDSPLAHAIRGRAAPVRARAGT